MKDDLRAVGFELEEVEYPGRRAYLFARRPHL